MRGLLHRLRQSRLGQSIAQLPVLRWWLPSFAAARHLWSTYGHARSVRAQSAVDARGEPVPWYTYPAIEYLRQLDFSTARVFEYGSGQSTLFWAREAAEVVSVEDDEEWYARMRPRLPAHCTYRLEPDLHRYVEAIRPFGAFDVIVVDGPARGRTRLKCAREALAHLRPGGLVILDNSDWLPESAALLRNADLLQVDLSGFVPLAGHTQTTSLFFHRDFRLPPKGGRQPHPSVAAVRKLWEDDPSANASRGAGERLEWDGQRISGVLERAVMARGGPEGTRHFEIAVREHGGGRAAFIYDADHERILVGPYALPAGDLTAEREAARLAALSWDAFCAFVRHQPTRRYLLE